MGQLTDIPDKTVETYFRQCDMKITSCVDMDLVILE